MNIELVKIDIDEVEDGSNWGPGGEVFLKVNGKDFSIIVHPSGELDVEDHDLTEEEAEAAFDFFDSSDEVSKAFPGDLYP